LGRNWRRWHTVVHAPFTREGIEQCRREIAVIEEQLQAGHPDIYGLCLALADWSAELRILEGEQRQKKPRGLNPAAGKSDLSLVQLLIE
jgi:hypothetical protein